MPVIDNFSLLMAYRELFTCMLEDVAGENSQLHAEQWTEIMRSINESEVMPPLWALSLRLGLDEAEYLAVALAAVCEMGSLNTESLRFVHAAIFYGRIRGTDVCLSGLISQSGLFSLLWKEQPETFLLSRPLILHDEIAKYILAGCFYDSAERRWYPPLEKLPSGAEDEACIRLKELLKNGIVAVGGSKEERLSLVRSYGNAYNMAIYASAEHEPDVADCLLCAAVSGSLLYFSSLPESALEKLRFWQDASGVLVIVGVNEEAPSGLPFLSASNNIKSAPLTAIYGDDLRRQLTFMCEYIRRGNEAYARFGITGMPDAVGVCALFYGKSGTGKTMAANVISLNLGRPLLTVSLTEVFDKYIGETEKQIKRFFDEASKRNAILFFDEAEALFTRRTEVSSSHDKYANLSSSYLLKRIEQYTGVVILSTNLAQNIDSAFIRRMQFVIRFPMPERATRKSYWNDHMPGLDDTFLNELAEENLSLARIKEIVKMSAVLALYNEHSSILEDDIREALRMEMGKDSGCALC